MKVSSTSLFGRIAVLVWAMLGLLTAGSSALDLNNWVRNCAAAAFFLAIAAILLRYLARDVAKGAGWMPQWFRISLSLFMILLGVAQLAAASFRVFVEHYAVFG